VRNEQEKRDELNAHFATLKAGLDNATTIIAYPAEAGLTLWQAVVPAS
jgi:hypothetical protein